MDWDSAIRRAQRSPTLIKFRAAHGMEPRDLSNMLRSDEETFEDAQRSDLPMAGEQIMVETQEMFYNISDEETFVDAQRSDLPMAGEPIMVETQDDNQFDDKQSQAQGMFYNIFDDKQSQAQNELERALALSLLDVKNSCPDSEPAQSRARTSSPRRTYVAAGCLVEDTYGDVSWLQESSLAETAGGSHCTIKGSWCTLLTVGSTGGSWWWPRAEAAGLEGDSGKSTGLGAMGIAPKRAPGPRPAPYDISVIDMDR